ncbi:MAG: DUF523 domain-containing protein [Epsilonproteobacteria bacterium]|nr:DUF523 domain-containing protein [Campylobacterota bacterium]
MKKAALSACLAGRNCRYNGEIKGRSEVVAKLEKEGYEIVLFCPEDACFGTPREAMDLTVTDEGVKALTKFTGEDRTPCLVEYAENFFNDHPDITLFVGKARSPSCGVCTARLYDEEGRLLSENEAGVMAAEAKARGVETLDDEAFLPLQE